MKEIKIVEYDHSYAEALAKMWNMSAESWGGSDSVKNGRDISESMENAGNISNFLAIDGKEVVGFCSFSEYREDEGASYIPLLNVRPDYHGKKVGKQLVLHAVGRAIKSQWPRLDLYTWPGNTKAVPLYKKCGFFWEKRDDSTHLMNFIPTVLKTEAVADYFKSIDWYKDSKREIQVKPDGRNENGFDFFEYSWENEKTKLRMEFCRRGRGLRLIETEDYIVSTSIDSHELVFGQTYKVLYKIINKSRKPLKIKIKGEKDKNIRFEFYKECVVEDERVLEGEFYVGEIHEEQSQWRTHPCVTSNISINGKEAIFKLGIEPKYPAKISLVMAEKPIKRQKESICYLNIENSFKEEACFQFELKDTDHIRFIQKEITVQLRGKERTSIPVPFVLSQYCFYDQKIEIQVSLKAREFAFEKRLSAIFKGTNSKFGAAMEDGWRICNGNYTLYLNHFNNEISVQDFRKRGAVTNLKYPKLGQPFSLEFSKIKPKKVEFLEEDICIALKATYQSRDFEYLQIVSISKLDHNGNVEHYYEIHNTSTELTPEEVYISQSFFYDLVDSYMSYGGRIIEVQPSDGFYWDYWDTGEITENWLFAEHKAGVRGITWDSNSRINTNGHLLMIDTNLGKIPKKSFRQTSPLYLAGESFNHWQEFRKFALDKEKMKPEETTNSFLWEINQGNPFVEDTVEIQLKEQKKVDFDGEIRISSLKNAMEPIQKAYTKKEGKRKDVLSISIKNHKPLDILKMDIDFERAAFEDQKGYFTITKDQITEEHQKENGRDIYQISNGKISIKADPKFSHGIHSLVYQGQEWLDSSYPNPIPKSWWSPWVGGITLSPIELSNISRQEEKKTCEFVTLPDVFGNQWKGIKVNIKVEKNEKWRGLEINQYFLLLPGLELLCCVGEIKQNTGLFMNHIVLESEAYLKVDEELTQSSFSVINKNGHKVRHKCGKIEQHIKTDLPILYQGESRKEKLYIYGPNEEGVYGYSNNHINGRFMETTISLPNGKNSFTAPMFLIFSEDEINESWIKTLRSVKFDQE